MNTNEYPNLNARFPTFSYEPVDSLGAQRTQNEQINDLLQRMPASRHKEECCIEKNFVKLISGDPPPCSLICIAILKCIK